jgi:hypothetical protein
MLSRPSAQAQNDAAGFASPEAVAAKTKYDQSLATGRDQYVMDLEAAMKVSLQSGKLEEANAINEAKEKLVAGAITLPVFQSAGANAAKAKYLQTIGVARQQYYRDLDVALKAAMAATNLNEANAINAERRRLIDEAKAEAPGAAAATPKPVAPTSTANQTLSKSGLLVQEFARQPSQTPANNFCIEPEEFGKPFPKTFTAKSLLGWQYNRDRNAIASGFLLIEHDGEYSFNSNSNFNRNALIVNGVMIHKPRESGAKVETIQLKMGYVPISSIGMVENKGTVLVKWKPPGQNELSEIPARLLKH